MLRVLRVLSSGFIGFKVEAGLRVQSSLGLRAQVCLGKSPRFRSHGIFSGLLLAQHSCRVAAVFALLLELLSLQAFLSIN